MFLLRDEGVCVCEREGEREMEDGKRTKTKVVKAQTCRGRRTKGAVSCEEQQSSLTHTRQKLPLSLSVQSRLGCVCSL